MLDFSKAELAAMAATQKSAMMDTCTLLVRSTSGVDEYGLPIVSWVDGETLRCGLDMRASREMLNAEAHVYDARLRLPIDTRVSNVDRVRITDRFGELLHAPMYFDFIGEPRWGPSGIVIDLRTVTNV
jgi:head-tail adaptor